MPIKEQYQLTRFLRADFFFFFSASDRTLSRSARTLTADSIVTAMFRFSQQKATLYPRLRVGYEGAIHHHSRCMCTLVIGDSDVAPPARTNDEDDNKARTDEDLILASKLFDDEFM